jgi:AraC family transcriptional regulator of adaptative response/methylated-DNA-[protein]-cysteine methyltransferase
MENCTFHETVAECIDAGFRPCKRCKPTTPEASADPVIKALISELERRPAYRWGEPDLRRMGLDPSTVRRSFKRHFGMTFLEMARQRRLQEGFSALADGGKVIEAQVSAGFDSASAFREAFAKTLGQAPWCVFDDPLLKADWVSTPLGPMIAIATSIPTASLGVSGPEGLAFGSQETAAQCQRQSWIWPDENHRPDPG